jgi:hypothetical protein
VDFPTAIEKSWAHSLRSRRPVAEIHACDQTVLMSAKGGCRTFGVIAVSLLLRLPERQFVVDEVETRLIRK